MDQQRCACMTSRTLCTLQLEGSDLESEFGTLTHTLTHTHLWKGTGNASLVDRRRATMLSSLQHVATDALPFALGAGT
jgi:hypothetical protein